MTPNQQQIPASAQTQSSNDPLAAFKDIQMPEVSTWWPLAWGWWVLILFSLIFLIWLTHFLIKKYRTGIAKKQAIKQIDQLSSADSLIQLNSLLKRAFLSYYQRDKVAGLHGKQWHRFLIQQLPASKQTQFHDPLQQFIERIYQPNQTLTDIDKQQIKHYLKTVLPISHSQLRGQDV